jgi:hypothetical protein
MVVLRAIGRFIRNIVIGAPITPEDAQGYTQAQSDIATYSDLPGANLAARHSNNSYGPYPF